MSVKKEICEKCGQKSVTALLGVLDKRRICGDCFAKMITRDELERDYLPN